MAVGERWRQTAAVAGFAELFRDRELTELSERIFGRIVNPEDILRFAAAAPPADERRAEALLRAGRLGEARFESTRLVHAMPGEARHWRRLLTVRAKAGRSGQDDVRLCALQLAMMNPEDYRNWYTLGVANFDAGLHINAIEAFREVLVREPDHEPSRMGRAHSLMALGRNREAENDLRAVLEHSPGHLTAVRRLARLVKRRGDPEEAVRLLQSVCTGTVDSRVGLFADLANLQRQLGDLQACRATVDRILEHDPDNASALACLGRLLVDEPDGRSAVAVFERRAQLHPDDLPAHLHLGHARLVAGDPEGAIRSYDAGLAIRPADAQANWNRAWPLLLLGRYEEGWKAYEWRFAARMAHPVCPLKTQWKGEPLDGRRILVWGEQGAGDTIQFLRFARVLKEAGAIVKAMVPPELNRLFTSCPTLEAVYSDRPGKDEYDTHCALGGLPGRLGVRLEDLGPEAPWLAAPASPGPELVSAIDAAGAGLRAGLCWSGNILFAWNHKRSIDPAYLTPLTGAPGVRWFGLQKEAAGAPVAEVCARLGATDLSPWFTDFADTATAISRLDLVITVDTAVAHLAGALGRPVWLLLGFAPDWRWLLDRDDTPWYPAMRLFRQREPGDWAEVIERVRVALQEVLSGKATLATSR